MGKITGGPAKYISGRVGDFIYSQQADGTTTVREVSKVSEVEPSPGRLSTYQDTNITAAFLKPIKEFIAVSYELQGKLEKRRAYNSMVSHLRTAALTGTYPERKIDFSKLLVSQGKMPVVQNAAVTLEETGFSFTWDSQISNNGFHYSDQVMMLAYFPELAEAKYIAGSAQRHLGTEVLTLKGIQQGYTAEIYISFISNDRKSISNSVYLGQLIW